jgi:hypothetical protein
MSDPPLAAHPLLDVVLAVTVFVSYMAVTCLRLSIRLILIQYLQFTTN